MRNVYGRKRESQSGGESHRLLHKPYCAEFSALLRSELNTFVFLVNKLQTKLGIYVR